MVEVAPRSGPLRIHIKSCLVFLFLLLLLLLGILYSMFGTSWGASNSIIESARRYLSIINKFRPSAKPQNDLKSALRVHCVESIGVKRYALYFSMTDSNSEPVLAFSPSEISLSVGDLGASRKPVIVDKVTPLHMFNQWNERLFFSAIMDYSGSMFAEDIENIKKNCSGLTNGILFPFQANVIKFSGSVDERIPLTADKTKIESAICDGYPIGDSTSLYNAIDQGLTAIQSQPHMRFLLATTDGNDNSSSISLDETVRRLKLHGVSAFIFGFGWLKVEVLKKIAEDTDGFYIYTPDSSELSSWFPKLAKIINNIQVLEFSTQNDVSIPCTIDLTIKHAGTEMRRTK
ncbi:MAG: VWA domain-containing protein [Candidatus Riflebacteria bacterium]|nr:VWA domain-containing protein [Candidatus Riflebacteria bacterium]